MSDVPPPLPGEKQKFKIASYNFAAAVGAIAYVSFLNWDQMDSSPESSGGLAGLALGCILFPILVSWFFYFVCRRSNKVGNVVFAVVLVCS